MSILINMEMPTQGELLCLNIYPDGKVCIALDLECKQIATAVSVPAHGKMIIRDGEVIERDGSTDVRDYGKEIT